MIWRRRPSEPQRKQKVAGGGEAPDLFVAAEKIMRTVRHRVISALTRCASLRCPACGQSSIFQAPFRVRHHCPSCAALFQREEGFFIGALMANVVATELVAVALYVVCLLTIGYNDLLLLVAALPLAFILPVGFYHHSWSVWLSFDYMVEGLPKYKGRGRAA